MALPEYKDLNTGDYHNFNITVHESLVMLWLVPTRQKDEKQFQLHAAPQMSFFLSISLHKYDVQIAGVKNMSIYQIKKTRTNFDIPETSQRHQIGTWAGSNPAEHE